MLYICTHMATVGVKELTCDTCDTDVAGLQIGHDLFGTAMHSVQDGIRNWQLTVTTS